MASAHRRSVTQINNRKNTRPRSDLLGLLVAALGAVAGGLALIWILDYSGVRGVWRIFALANTAFLPGMLWRCRTYLKDWMSRLQFGAWAVLHLAICTLLIRQGLSILLFIILFAAEAIVLRSYFSARTALKKD